jgi:hypothetical protein
MINSEEKILYTFQLCENAEFRALIDFFFKHNNKHTTCTSDRKHSFLFPFSTLFWKRVTFQLHKGMPTLTSAQDHPVKLSEV